MCNEQLWAMHRVKQFKYVNLEFNFYRILKINLELKIAYVLNLIKLNTVNIENTKLR